MRPRPPGRQPGEGEPLTHRTSTEGPATTRPGRLRLSRRGRPAQGPVAAMDLAWVRPSRPPVPSPGPAEGGAAGRCSDLGDSSHGAPHWRLLDLTIGPEHGSAPSTPIPGQRVITRTSRSRAQTAWAVMKT